jgi:hypothetical protein
MRDDAGWFPNKIGTAGGSPRGPYAATCHRGNREQAATPIDYQTEVLDAATMLSVRYGRLLPPFYRVVGHSKMLLSVQKPFAVSDGAILQCAVEYEVAQPVLMKTEDPAGALSLANE